MADKLPEGFREVRLPPSFYEVPAPTSAAPSVKQPDLPEGIVANIPGALKETFGGGDRPGAVPLTGAPGTKTPLGVVVKPEGWAEHLASGAATMAPVAGAGAAGKALLTAAPKVGAALGRIGAGAGIGAGREMAATGGVGWGTFIDAALEGGTEGLMAGLGKALKGSGAASRGVKWATGALEPALDYVRDRLKTTRMVIPSIDPVKKITWDEAIAALKKMSGQDYKVARAEIANWMNAADKQELRPRAGQVFKDMTSKMRFPASSFSELAEQTRGVVGANVPRAVADVAATERVTDAEIPAGLVALETLKRGAGRAMEHLPGVGPFLKAAERVTP